MAAMKRKRDEVDEFGDLSSVTYPSPNAKVSGVLTDLSPMKDSKGGPYFDGQIADEKGSMRVYGFDIGVRKKLLEHYEKNEPVELARCQVKFAKKSDALELEVGKSTSIKQSPKVFDVQSNIKGISTPLAHVGNMKDYTKVNATVKVQVVHRPEDIGSGRKKQDVIVSDKTAHTKVTVWAHDIGKMAVGKSYMLTGMWVREFRGERYLTTAKTDCEITEIDDIGDVKSYDVPKTQVKQPGDESNVKIIGVERIDAYSGCLKCSNQVVKCEEDADYGQCSKCEMLQAFEDCASIHSAHVTVKTASGTKLHLQVFDQVLVDIAQKSPSDITKFTLLKSMPFSMYHRDGVIHSISRTSSTDD